IMGAVIMAAGGLLLLLGKPPFNAYLPEDIHVEGGNISFHCPVAACIVISMVLTIILNVILYLFRK
ncbi:MAG: DUF2905 domain-containing protein, partial [Kiritimatiellia bacterium]